MIIEAAQFLTILATGLFFLCFVFSIFFNVNDVNIIKLISRIYSHSFFLFLSSFLIYVWPAIYQKRGQKLKKTMRIYYSVKFINILIVYKEELIS